MLDKYTKTNQGFGQSMLATFIVQDLHLLSKFVSPPVFVQFLINHKSLTDGFVGLLSRSFQNFMSQANPETMASMGGGNLGKLSPEMMKTASNMISKMPPDEFQKMLQMATSFQAENPSLNRGSTGSNNGSGMPNVTPDMLKTATDMMSNMPPEELQKMFEMASSLNGGSQLNMNINSNSSEGQERHRISRDNGTNSESRPSQEFINSRSAPQPNFPSSSSDIRSQLKNPAMREV